MGVRQALHPLQVSLPSWVLTENPLGLPGDKLPVRPVHIQVPCVPRWGHAGAGQGSVVARGVPGGRQGCQVPRLRS